MTSNTSSAPLCKFDELYSAATVAEGAPSSSDIPDGEYVMVVEFHYVPLDYHEDQLRGLVEPGIFKEKNRIERTDRLGKAL